MEIIDEIRKDLTRKKIEKLTEKSNNLDARIYEIENDIQGFRQDEWDVQDRRNHGEPVDPYIEKYSTKFRQRAERDWLRCINKKERVENKLSKAENKLGKLEGKKAPKAKTFGEE